MNGQLVRSERDVAFAIPDGWEGMTTAEDDGVVALEPGTAGFRANAVLVSGPVTTDDPRRWQGGVEADLPRVLANYQLIDLEQCVVAGLAGGRRLAQYTSERGDYLSMEQWFTVDADRIGHTLTTTVQTFRYSVLAPAFRAIADSLTLPGVSR